jgi:hypothetical protein
MNFRSVGAVLAGFVSIFAVTTAVDVALHAAGVFPPLGAYTTSGPLVIATGYRLLINTGGSYLTARLASARPLFHALVLGAIGFVLSIAGGLAFRDLGPIWYPIAVIAMAPLCAWAGGRLRELELARTHPLATGRHDLAESRHVG